MEIIIRKLNQFHISEMQDLLHEFSNAFEWTDFRPPNESWLKEVLENPRLFVFAAFADSKVIGGLTAYSLQQYSSASEIVYVYDLAVSQTWRRRGVGKKLMTELFDFCKSQKIFEVFVQADEEDVEAIAFYNSIGAISKTAKDFTYYLAPI